MIDKSKTTVAFKDKYRHSKRRFLFTCPHSWPGANIVQSSGECSLVSTLIRLVKALLPCSITTGAQTVSMLCAYVLPDKIREDPFWDLDKRN